MANFNNVMVDRGNITGTIERSVDMEAAALTLTNRDEEGAMKVNLSHAFFLTDRGDVQSHSTIKNNCIAMASDYGFNQYVLA